MIGDPANFLLADNPPGTDQNLHIAAQWVHLPKYTSNQNAVVFSSVVHSDGNANDSTQPCLCFLLSSWDMSRLLNEITHAYPSLAIELSSLPANEASDSRLMAELVNHVVDQFEAGRAEDIRPAFELTEHLIATGPDGER